MRVLVTGARGFVGSHTLRPLVEAQFEVHALSREAPTGGDAAVHWHRGDLLSSDVPRQIIEHVRPTHLLHLAWETTHGEYWSSPANVRWEFRSIKAP